MLKSYRKIEGFILLLLFFISNSYYVYSHYCNHEDISYITVGIFSSEHEPCNRQSQKGCGEPDSHSCTRSCCSIDEISSDPIIINAEKRISKQDEGFKEAFFPVAVIIGYASPLICSKVKSTLSSLSINTLITTLKFLSSIRLIC